MLVLYRSVTLACLVTIISKHINGQQVATPRRIGMQQRRINAQQRQRINAQQQQRINPQQQRLNPQQQNIIAQPQAMNAQQRTINGQPQTINAQPQAINTQAQNAEQASSMNGQQGSVNPQQQQGSVTTQQQQQQQQQQGSVTTQQQMINNGQLNPSTDQQQVSNTHFIQTHHPARPSHVKGRSKDLMAQVVANALKGQGDHPQKFHDYLDNGASWEHMSSPVQDHQSALNIHDRNYHVHMTYGINDEETQNAKLHNQEDTSSLGDTFAGDGNMGENSLSKFMAPPVYDEEGDGYQKDKAEVDAKYQPDRKYTPKEAATEKENTEQLVDRLHSLMAPLPLLGGDSEGEGGDIKRDSKANVDGVNQLKEEASVIDNGEVSEGAFTSRTVSSQPEITPFSRQAEREVHIYDEPGENTEEQFRKSTDQKSESSEEVKRMGDSGEQYRAFHKDEKGTSNEREEHEDDSNDHRNLQRASDEYAHGRNLRKKFNFLDRDNNNNDEWYHQHMRNRRVKSYFRGGGSRGYRERGDSEHRYRDNQDSNEQERDHVRTD